MRREIVNVRWGRPVLCFGSVFRVSETGTIGQNLSIAARELRDYESDLALLDRSPRQLPSKFLKHLIFIQSLGFKKENVANTINLRKPAVVLYA